MPIARYREKGAVFTPQAISAMSKALESTAEALGINGDEKKRRAVAKFILRLAQDDAFANPEDPLPAYVALLERAITLLDAHAAELERLGRRLRRALRRWMSTGRRRSM